MSLINVSWVTTLAKPYMFSTPVADETRLCLCWRNPITVATGLHDWYFIPQTEFVFRTLARSNGKTTAWLGHWNPWHKEKSSWLFVGLWELGNIALSKVVSHFLNWNSSALSYSELPYSIPTTYFSRDYPGIWSTNQWHRNMIAIFLHHITLDVNWNSRTQLYKVWVELTKDFRSLHPLTVPISYSWCCGKFSWMSSIDPTF